MTKLETITNENGITYFPIFEEMESIGKHFFLDKNFELICCPSLVNGGYDTSGMEYVEDWIINELTETQKAELKKIPNTLRIQIKEKNNG